MLFDITYHVYAGTFVENNFFLRTGGRVEEIVVFGDLARRSFMVFLSGRIWRTGIVGDDIFKSKLCSGCEIECSSRE